MFNDIVFTLSTREVDLSNSDENIIIKVNNVTLIAALDKIDFKAGEESDIMAETLLGLIKEINKTFNILFVS